MVKKNRKWLILTGLLTLACSEIYFSMFSTDFRVSPAVILFPLLLVTVDRDIPLFLAGMVTCAEVFAGRVIIYLSRGTAALAAVRSVFPGACFYVVYSFLFGRIVKNRYTVSSIRAASAAGLADFLSNLCELLLRFLLAGEAFPDLPSLLKVFMVAFARSVCVYVLLLLLSDYRFLLKRAEHEKRYRRLFLITADLKSEMYLMEKNSRQIEQVMKSAYTLYERLNTPAYPAELKNDCLDIARRVHDIKKDYYRVIRGMEEEIGKNPDESEMSLDDLFTILSETMRTDISDKGRDIVVATEASYPFHTEKHYSLMSILLNLVTNASEAIPPERKGRITVRERREGEEVVFEVEDNGSGIPEKRLPMIFEMGYSSKYDEVTGNAYRGVGLSSVRQLVCEQLGGTIDVASEEGAGTRFTVRIPAENIMEGEQE